MANDRYDDYRDDRDGRDDDFPREPRQHRDFEPPHSNGLATASLVLGVLALCGGLTALPGLVCGVIALGRAGSRGGAGKGMALAGIVLSCSSVLLAIPLLILLLLPAVYKVREAASRQASSSNLKQITLGQQFSFDANLKLEPDHYVGPRDGKPSRLSDRLSWRVAMLPYIEQSSLYNSFRHDEPWNSPTNRPHSQVFIKTYIHPSDGNAEPTTRYRIFYGGGAAYDLERPLNIAAIPDGSSNTISVVEGGDRVVWSQFDEYPFSMDGPLPKLGTPNSTVFLVSMFDGSVRTLRTSIDPKVLKSGIHASDGRFLDE